MVKLTYTPAESEISAIKKMTDDARADLAARIKATDPFTIFDSVEGKEGKEIVCPFCGSGTGKKHTGVTPTNKNGVWLYNCFACGSFHGDLLSIIAEANNLSINGADFFTVLVIGAKILNFPLDNPPTYKGGNSTPINKKPAKKKSDEKIPVVKFERLDEARKNLSALFADKEKWRGLDIDIISRLNWGYLPDIYFPDAQKKLPAVIIPNDKGGVFARAVEGKFYRNNNPTATTTLSIPYNEKFDIVVVEGAINGASILQALGFNPAFNAYPKFGIIASGGTSGNKHVLEKLQELKAAGKKICVLIAYDNDSHKKGQIAAEKLLQMLKKAGFTACVIDITKIPDIDLNDVLRGDGGEKKLAEMVNSAVALAQGELKKAAAEIIPVNDSDSTDKDNNSAQINSLEAELQEVQKEKAAFDAEKESAIEKLKSVEKFDFNTCFSAEIVKGAAFAKLYCKEVYARACVDIQAANEKEKFLRNWQGAVKEMEGEISSRAAKLNYRIAQIKSQIAALKFGNDNSEIMQGLEFPIGFSVSSAGEIVKTTEKGEITICRAPVVITQRYFGVDTNFYKWQLAIKKLSKWQLIPPLEQATLADKNKLIPAVSNFGLPVNSVNSGGVVDYLDAFLAHNKGKFPTTYTARQFGWNNFNGKDFFLDPRRNCTVEVDGVNCPFIADSAQSQFAKSLISAGNIENWKQLYFKVKKIPLARFIVAACFAAPLLKILNQRNFLLYIYGKTRAGKTTALLLGVSGVGSEKMLRTFDATKNGLIGAALEANDYVFAVDEKQAADKRIVEQIHNLIYSFGNGTERVKLRKDSSLREVREWRGVGVMTGETPLTDDNVTGGANTRALQLPAPNVIIPADICAEIRETIKSNYGVAFNPYIDKIFEYGNENLREDFKELKEGFTENFPSILPDYCGYVAIVTLADSLLNQSLGVDRDTADNESIDNAVEILKIVPTTEEISDFDRAKEMVLSFIAQNQKYFLGATQAQIENLPYVYGRFTDDFVHIIDKILKQACDETGFNYSKVVADLVEGGFFIPADSIEKDRKEPRPTVKVTIGLTKPRCYRIPRAFFDSEK